MKHLLQIYILFSIVVIVSACSDDDLASVASVDDGVVTASIQQLEMCTDDEPTTRTSLTYDPTNKVMTFAWDENDTKNTIGIFSYDTKASQQTFYRQKEANTTYNTPAGVFHEEASAEEEADYHLNPYTKYISYRPVVTGSGSDNLWHDAVPVHYDGQTAKGNPKMGIRFSSTNGASDADYLASEAEASAHLGDYDYLASDPVVSGPNGGVPFDLDRVGVVVRFYLRCPEAVVFDELQLVTTGTTHFTIEGTMNLTTKEITATKTGSVQALKYKDGLDMTNTTGEYYYKNVGYIVSYMMLAPINIQENTTYLYLLAHDGAGNKKYYKSKGYLHAKNLTKNMFYQWVTSNYETEEPIPITFSEVTVQQWKDDTAIDNGTEGTGTIGW